MSRKFNIIYKILPIVFISILVFPFVNQYLHAVDNDMSKTERRKPTPKPEFEVENLDPFPREYEKYYNDNFGLRKVFLTALSYLNFKVLGISGSSNAVLGKDNWIFMKKSILEPLSEKRFSSDELEKYKKELVNRVNYYKSKNADWFLIIVPGKSTVYPEYLPYYYGGRDSLTRIDQFLEYFQKTELSNNVIYLKELLKEKKNDNLPLFYKIDNHWNKLAGFWSAQKILDHIAKVNRNVIPNLSSEKYDIVWKEKMDGNQISAIGGLKLIEDTEPVFNVKDEAVKIHNGKKRKYEVPKRFAYKWAYQIVKKSNSDNGTKALIIRDSFTTNLIPFLSTGFGESVYIWDVWRYKTNKDIFENEKPDVVLTIISETYLSCLLKYGESGL